MGLFLMGNLINHGMYNQQQLLFFWDCTGITKKIAVAAIFQGLVGDEL